MLLLAFGPGARTAQLAKLLGDLETRIGIKVRETLVKLPTRQTLVRVEKPVLELDELGRVLVLAIGQQIKVRAKVGQVKVGVAQPHFVEINHLEASIN